MTEAPKLLSLRIVRFAPVKPLERQRINSGFPPALFLRGGRVAAALGVSLLCFTDGMANPAGGSVRHGSATIVQNGDQVTINQSSGIAILDWHSFSIAQGETTKFIQPSSSSVALNRVNGGTQSLINGRLEANGGIVLINPAGIVVGPSGVVNVNSFIASTHDVTDDEFLSGGAMKFQGSSEASIQNLGTIHAESGDIFLIAHSVINEGTLSAKKGTVGLVAANEVLLRPDGDEKLSILSQEATGGKISHSGTIEAVSAEIKAAGNPYAVAINLDGVIQAKGALGKKAKVIVDAGQGDIQVAKTVKIDAGGDSEGGKVIVQSKGNLEIAGTILATSATGNGGEVQLLGDSIHLGSTAVVDASGFAGGGKIFVGGDYQGGNNPDVHYSSTALRNAQTLVVEQGAELMANATGNGNGGVIIQWSDGTTVSSGAVSVKGGPLGGNGGFAEISGKQNLGFNGTVDLAAPNGKAGTVLFDPSTLYIHDVETTADGPLPTSQTLYLSGADNNYWLSTAVINSIANGTVLLQANNVQFSEPGGFNLGNIILQPNVSLQIQATTGDLIMPSGSSITASGSGWVQMYASQKLNLGGSIQTDTGYIGLHAQSGNINFSPGSSIQQNNGSIQIWSDYGSILGSSHINSVSSSVNISANTYNPNNLGSIDFSGEIKTGLNGISSGGGIHLDARNTLTFNGILNSVGGDINLNGTHGITLGNLDSSTAVSTANNWIALSAPMIQLNGTALSAPNGGISFNNGDLMILTGSTLATISSASGNIFNNLSASQINLYANSVSLSDPNGANPSSITLGRNGNLYIQASSGDLLIPSLASITASGTGWVQLYAAQAMNLGGALQTDTGYIQFHAQNGNINLSPGSTIQQNNGGISIWTDYGSILGSSHINSASSWINLSAYTYTPGTTVGSIDLSGEIKTGLNGISSGGGIHLDARNTLTFNGILNSVGGDINLNGTHGITLGNADQNTAVTTANNWISLSAPNIQLNGTALSSVNGGISFNNGDQMILTGNTLATISSTSGNIFNNLSASQINLYANSVSLSDPNGANPSSITLGRNGNLYIQASSGDLLIPSLASITASGTGWVQLYAAQAMNLGGALQTDTGYIQFHAQNGNINLSPGSTIQQNNGGISIWTDYGSILGSSHINSASSWINLSAYTYTPGTTVGSIDLSGEIKTGLNGISSGGGIHLDARNTLTFNGILNSVGGDINLNGTHGITLGNADQNTAVTTANNWISLSAPNIQLNGTALSSVNGGISFNNGDQMILTGNTLATISSTSGNIFNNLSASQINLSANTVSLTGQAIHLPTDTSLTVQAYSGGLTLPSGSSITASGNGWVQLYSYGPLGNSSIAGSIQTQNGGIRIYSQYGPLNLFGATITQTGYGGIQIWSDAGLIQGTSLQISSARDWVYILNNNSLNLSGSISTGVPGPSGSSGGWINLSANNGNLSFNGTIASVGNSIVLSSGNQINLGALNVPTIFSTVGNLQLSSPQLSLVNTPLFLVGSLSGAFGTITPSTVQFNSQNPLSKIYDGTTDIELSAQNFTINGLNTSYAAEVLSVSGMLNSPDVKFANSVDITSLVLQLSGPHQSINGNFSLDVNNLSLAGHITPAPVTVGLVGSTTKVYDTTRNASVSGANFSALGGVLGDDQVALTPVSAGLYDSKDAGTGKSVTVNIGLNNGNYQLVDGEGRVITSISASIGAITPAPVTVGLVGSTTKVYDTTRNASVSGANFSDLGGVLGDDRVALTPVSAGLYDTKDAGTGKTVTVNVGLNNANYQLVDSEGRVITSISASIGAIMKMTLTATLTGDVTQQYNGNAVATISPANYILNGTIYGSDAGNLGLNNPITGSYDNANAGSGKKVTVDGLALTGSAANNYQLVSTTIDGNIGTITKAPVSASLIGDLTKQYNGNAAATISPDNYLLNGILGRDAGNVGLNNPVTGSYDNPNPGAGINVTVNGLALTGSAAPNYQLVSATINAPIGTITAPPSPPLNTTVTGLMNNSDFMRMASAVMGPPPAAGGMGPAGPAMGGSFGGMGPSGGMGGFSSGASFGGPAPSSAPAPSGPGGGGEMAGGPSGSGGPSPAAGPGGEGAAPPPPGSEGSSGGESGAAPGTPGAPVAGGPGGEAAPGAPAPAAAPGAPNSSGSSAGTGGSVASGAPGGAGLAGTAASAPHVPASIAAVNTMNNPIPSSVGQAHSLNAFSAAADHGGVESGGSSSAAAGASGSGKSQSSAGGRSGTMGFGSDPETAESVNSTITTLMMVL